MSLIMKRTIVRSGLIAVVLGLVAAGVSGVMLKRREWNDWWTTLTAGARESVRSGVASTDAHGHDDHAHDEHGHEAHPAESAAAAGTSVLVSDPARVNLQLTIAPVTLGTFTQELVIPGEVVEQPGHCERRVTTKIPGVVTKVHAFPGQIVRPGDPLMDLQPTGDLLATAQSALLETLKNLELGQAELNRIAPLVENGSIPARTKIEKEYEQKRLEALKLVQIQDLLVRGLTAAQVNEIVAHRELLREFTIRVPGKEAELDTQPRDHAHPDVVPTRFVTGDHLADSGPTAHSDADAVYTLERIDVFPGSLVSAGAPLCDLAEHTELYLEGHAFERDDARIAAVIEQGLPLRAVFDVDVIPPWIRDQLHIRYVDNSLDAASRTVRFYVPLKNEILRDSIGDNGVMYRSWRFKPGQKVKLLLPETVLSDVIVLPGDAVVQEGLEWFVFRENGQLMEQVSVVVLARNPREVALRYDGSLYPGDHVAMNQAYQLHLALRKQAGGGVDLHAGHSH
jgi:membrane fusion protein, heavy metal efflux system